MALTSGFYGLFFIWITFHPNILILWTKRYCFYAILFSYGTWKRLHFLTIHMYISLGRLSSNIGEFWALSFTRRIRNFELWGLAEFFIANTQIHQRQIKNLQRTVLQFYIQNFREKDFSISQSSTRKGLPWKITLQRKMMIFVERVPLVESKRDSNVEFPSWGQGSLI